MEVTPEPGGSQDRRKYILSCAKRRASKAFGRFRILRHFPEMTRKCHDLCLQSHAQMFRKLRMMLDRGHQLSHYWLPVFFSDAFQTIFPPTNVLTTLTSRILAGSMVKMSSLSRTISASFPGVIEPFSFS